MDKTIYLTFDDGPNEPYTSQTLEILKTFGAKATFFVCGQNIEKHPESLKKILDGGHAIGNHSYFHNLTTVLMAGNKLKDEIEKTNRLIKMHTGMESRLYRSPWGLTMPWIKPWLKANNFKVFRWDILAYDWRQPPADWMAKHIINSVNKKTASACPTKLQRSRDPIILLHDGNQTFSGDRGQTVRALPLILENLLKQNYKFRALNSGIL